MSSTAWSPELDDDWDLDEQDDDTDDDGGVDETRQQWIDEGIRRARCTCHDTHARGCGSRVDDGGLLAQVARWFR